MEEPGFSYSSRGAITVTDYQHRQRAEEVVDDSTSGEPFAAYVEPISQLLPKTPVLQRIRDYQLLEVVGRGGMGTVYKAQHLRLGKVRAVKVLAPQLLDNPEAVERFRLEIENCGRLEHPNIVQALDAGEESGMQFLVMEFVEGVDLAHLVAAHEPSGPLPVPMACALLRQAAVGLHHVHQHFLVHRDIKPSNLMLNHSGTVKILDLGLARFIAQHLPATRLTMTHGPMGTCDYMAPEQWSDASAVDIRADIYSLGCTLYFLLTGKPPYTGENCRSLVKKQLAHQHAPVPDVLQERPDVASGLSSVLQRMMAKLPEQRFSEPIEVARAVTPFVGSAPWEAPLAALVGLTAPHAHPTDLHLSSSLTETNRMRRSGSAAEPAASRVNRRRWWLWAAAAAVLLAACGWMLPSLVFGPSSGPTDDALAGDLASLPGLNGKWWFDEMPWYTPFVRNALAEAVAQGNTTQVLGNHLEGYLDPNIAQVQQWLLGAVGHCRQRLSPRQITLLDALIAISKEELDDKDLEQRLSASFQRFAVERGESEAWSAEDLYTRAVLEHKLAELRNDQALAEQARSSYDAACMLLDALPGPASKLGLLCRADSACLCYMVLRDFPAALERLEDAAVETAPLLFRVETLISYGQAGRVAGHYEKDEMLRLAQRILDGSPQIASDHPLRAHACERLAWSLMDQWRVESAYHLFEEAGNIRAVNGKQNPLAAVFVFHNAHGKAMAQRYRGNAAAARWEYTDVVLPDINTALSEAMPDETPRPGRQRQIRDLRERQSNALERRADCELYEGAASAPQSVDLARAADDYGQAGAMADDPAAQVVHACKRCLALALGGDVATADREFTQDEIRAREIIGQGQERVRVARQLTEAVLACKRAADPAAGCEPLRRFLRQFDLDPYHSDRLRRETLEMQLLAMELLINSQLNSPSDDTLRLEDVEHLERLLAAFEQRLESHSAVDDMLPFLRRFYGLGIAATAEKVPDRAARLILASRGPNHHPKSGALNILFHVQSQRTIVVAVRPDDTTLAFTVEGLGRDQLRRKRADRGGHPVPKLPDDLARLIAAGADAGARAECLWSDRCCWPDNQGQMALTAEDFPWPELLDKIVLK